MATTVYERGNERLDVLTIASAAGPQVIIAQLWLHDEPPLDMKCVIVRKEDVPSLIQALQVQSADGA